ncbi:hypothetical protein TNCV_4610431 [Trichonephila clavipes]|nr:hypothetical protein TNCV_4610431 [Trichonephila clavipes]
MLKEVEKDQENEEYAEIMDINYDSEINFLWHGRKNFRYVLRVTSYGYVMNRKNEELTEILCEIYFKEGILRVYKRPKLKIKGFTTLRKDRKDRAGGGLAFLVKSADIKFREIIMPPTTDYDENFYSTAAGSNNFSRQL